jgi:cystathionine beta-synthase
VWAIDPFGSLLTKYFRTGEVDMSEVHPYISEGIGEDFIPQNYDMKYVDAFEQVTDKDAAVMARRIAKEEGLFCGYSAGTALQGMLQLKDLLKKGDLPVVIFHDHGSRYVGKIYNDQWMMERGFLDVKTFKDIVSGRGAKRLISVVPEQTVAEAFELMQKYNVENLPVLKDGAVLGAISESGLFTRMMNNGQDIKNRKVGEVLEKPYPMVSFDTPLERLSNLITRENGAVLGQDDSGNYHIVTKYDVIQALNN